jgi:hypothetical protein
VPLVIGPLEISRFDFMRQPPRKATAGDFMLVKP